jgi:FkbM family methyltransferase
MPGSQSLRDQVRLRLPRLLAFYQRHVATRLGADRMLFDLSEWASRGPELVSRTGMHGIRFEPDGTWVDDGAGYLWAYRPGPMSSTLGAEYGLRYEEGEIDVLAQRITPGSTLVDIGANVGLHSVQLARRVEDLTVLALEPVSETFDLLERNIAKNGVRDSVTARRVAISDHEGTLRLTTSFQYGNFVVPDGAGASGQAVEEVRAQTLDSLVEELAVSVGAIKCDVEGAELGVLRGATATLERFRPLLLLEVDARWARRYGNEGTDVFEFLARRGYGYERFVDGRLEPATGSVTADLEHSSNFLFTAADPASTGG